MKISVVRSGGSAQVTLAGRLDREWAEQLSGTLERLVQLGVRSLRLDLDQVTYVSSAGMGVLGRWHQELAALRGDVKMEPVSAQARAAFDAAGWAPPQAGSSGGVVLTPHEHRRSSWFAQKDLTTFGAYEQNALRPPGSLTCRLIGDPALLDHGGFSEGVVLPFPEGSFGLGIGAIGDRWSEASGRLGELVAVNGSIATFPTDGARLPDYFTQAEQHGAPPTAVLAGGLCCTGGFSHLVRFAPRAEVDGIPFSELATVLLEATGAKLAGLVILAECAGMSGVRIRRPPVAGQPLVHEFPGTRDWLLFSPDRIHAMTTVLVGGVVARAPTPPLAAFLRPLGLTARLAGHFHAAVFGYHPLPQRTVELSVVLRTLFSTRHLRDVLHLVADDRRSGAVPETEFMRGVAWAGPISEVT